MAQKLAKSEQTCKLQREEIKEKSNLVYQLQQEIELSKKCGSNTEFRKEMALLKEENLKQKK